MLDETIIISLFDRWFAQSASKTGQTVRALLSREQRPTRQRVRRCNRHTIGSLSFCHCRVRAPLPSGSPEQWSVLPLACMANVSSLNTPLTTLISRPRRPAHLYLWRKQVVHMPCFSSVLLLAAIMDSGKQR